MITNILKMFGEVKTMSLYVKPRSFIFITCLVGLIIIIGIYLRVSFSSSFFFYHLPLFICIIMNLIMVDEWTKRLVLKVSKPNIRLLQMFPD